MRAFQDAMLYEGHISPTLSVSSVIIAREALLVWWFPAKQSLEPRMNRHVSMDTLPRLFAKQAHYQRV